MLFIIYTMIYIILILFFVVEYLISSIWHALWLIAKNVYIKSIHQNETNDKYMLVIAIIFEISYR